MINPERRFATWVETIRMPSLTWDAWFWQSALWVFTALVVVDVFAAYVIQMGVVGVVLWYLTYVYIVAFAALGLRDVVRNSLAQRAPFTLAMIALFLAIAAFNVTSPRSLSGETPHEISCAMQALTSDPGHGFRVGCLFGYPARQFFLPVVPSFLLGRSLFALNLGGSLYFLLATLIFAGGVVRYLRSSYAANLFAAAGLAVFLHVYFWNHFYLLFEQSIFPLCFALTLGGLLLYYLAGDTRALPIIGITLLYLIYSYTPSLAVFALALGVLAYLAVMDDASHARLPVFLTIIVGSLVALRVSLGFRHDINVDAGSNPHTRQDLWTALEHLIYQNHGVPFTSPVLVGPLVLLVALCLLWQFGPEGAAVGLWVIGVFVFAVVSHGYSVNSVDFRLHRSMIVFPVLITLLIVVARHWDLSRLERPLMVGFLVLLVTGLKFHIDYRNAQSPNPDLRFMAWLHAHVRSEGTSGHPRMMYWMPGAGQALPAIPDVMTYFVPSVQSVFPNAPETGPGCPIAPQLSGIVILQRTDPCYGPIKQRASSGAFRLDGTYVDAYGRRLAVFES